MFLERNAKENDTESSILEIEEFLSYKGNKKRYF